MENDQSLRCIILGGNYRGKGAEAMMTVVQQAIRGAFPDSVCRAIFSSEWERLRFVENGIHPIKRQSISLGSRIFQIVRPGLSPRVKKKSDPAKVGQWDSKNMFQLCDFVVDISGFASGDQFGWRRAVSRLIEIKRAKAAGNRILYMPQSWGPFNDSRTRFLTRLMLMHSEFVFAREKQSYNFLLDASCVKPEKLFLSPDIAFQFQAAKPDDVEHVLKKSGLSFKKEFVIAISPNMRIYERTQGKDRDNVYVKELLHIIHILLSNTSCNLLLIPHEATYDKANDYELSEILLKNSDGRGRVFLLDGKETAAETKAIIGMCEFLVASRYHSLIAALSMRVPSIVIGWSHKYDDVMGEVGLDDWVYDPVRRPGKAVGELVMDAWNQREEIRQILNKNVPQLEARSQFALQKMVDAIRILKGTD